MRYITLLVHIRLTYSKSLDKLDTEWRSWFYNQLDIPELMLVKATFMSKSAEEFNRWVRENRFVWDEGTKMYKFHK